MCTLALYFQVFDDWPVVIAANRDEFFDRPALAPRKLAEQPEIVGGLDLKAGGTWLGINQYGMVAGLLNRRSVQAPNPKPRSRGLLCLDALKETTPSKAAWMVSRQRPQLYNPFNLLLVSPQEAFVCFLSKGRIETVRLEPGFHMLTNLDVDDFECPRISRAYRRFAALECFCGDPTKLGELLADHEGFDPALPRSSALCVHLETYGTRSSSIIAIGRELANACHYFADGPPCRAPFEPAPLPRFEARVSKEI